jgi:type IV pilus assembly protein PilW
MKTTSRKQIPRDGQRQRLIGRGGFTLVETVVAMAMNVLLLLTLYNMLGFHSRSFNVQDQVADMVQNARSAMDRLVREVRMAGYQFNPALPAGAGIVTADAHTIVFTQDLNGNGNTSDPGESIAYALQTENGTQKLMRTSNGISEVAAIYVQDLEFRYWNAAGVELTRPVTSPG